MKATGVRMMIEQSPCGQTRRVLSIGTLIVFIVCLAALPCLAGNAGPSVETVLRSTPLYGTNGLAIDKDDHLVIAAINPKAIFVMDTDTGKILKKYTHPLITGPDDVSIAKDGSIYYTDIFSGNVGKISPVGEVTLMANLGPWVNSIRLSPDETKLYVGHCIGGDRMTEIDLKTRQTRIVAENVGWPNSSSFGPDGRYYSPLNMRGEVIRWNLQTGEREVVFRIPSPPSSVKFDAKGRMLVTEFITGTIWRYDLNTKERKMIAKNVTIGLDNIAIDSKGRMFIASNHNGGIQELYEDGRTREISPPGLLIPSGGAIINLAAGEEFVVGDYWNVRFYDTKSFKQTRHIPSGFYPWVQYKGQPEYAEVAKDFSYLLNVGLPMTVAASPDGNTLVISSWPSNCINVYDLKENRVTRTIDGNRPIYAMPFGGDLVVSELETHSVVAIAPDGKRRTLAEGLGMLKGADPEKKSWMPDWLRISMLRLIAKMSDGLVYPSGMTAQGKNLYVAEWFKGEILQIVADGQVLAKPKVVASGLKQPEGLAFAKDGSLLAIESAIGRLVKIDPASGKKTVLAEHLKTGLKPGFKAAPSYVFSGVSVGSDGSIYVSCDQGNEVVKVKE
ncbi:MAG TPA: SMP-30/gluconolactonase/LRE family protein [Syntrophorhabdaceae bacterium]|mgnify:CR=1 FL=1|nr:SMP-30/gluconolactonase/LRE family protein [Syntrophorhabdaceae bacterium]HPA07204.1 SMP-30/gluconolactonase/LRE family protein [Methanoregulaceae archaeon]